MARGIRPQFHIEDGVKLTIAVIFRCSGWGGVNGPIFNIIADTIPVIRLVYSGGTTKMKT
jgi:hypothetical protein